MATKSPALRAAPARFLHWWLLVAAAGIVAYLLHPDGVTGDSLYIAVAAASSVVAGALAQAQTGTNRHVGRLVAVGIGLSALGDLIYRVYGWLGNEPSVSFADIGWIGSYVGLLGGLLWLLKVSSREGRVHLDAVIDAASVFTVSCLVCWNVSIGETVTDGALPIVVRAVWAAYPILDSVLLAVVIRAAVSGGLRSRVGVALGVGATCWLASDFAFLAGADSTAAGRWLDMGWLAGAALLAASVGVDAHGMGGASMIRRLRAAAPVSPAAAGDDLADRRGPGPERVGVVFLPLIVPSAIALVLAGRGHMAGVVPLFVANAVLVFLAFWRAARMQRSDRGSRAQLRSAGRCYAALAAGGADAVVVLDEHFAIVRNADRFHALMGSSPGSAVAADFVDALAPADEALVRAALDASIRAPGEASEIELEVRQGGDIRHLAARFTNLLHDPDVTGIVVNLHDVSARRRAEDELVRQAFHDALTGLPNRALFWDRVEHALDHRARTGRDPIVMYIDLDGFKAVNDSLGHDAGDELLRAVTDRVTGAVRSSDTVARLGGDEFGVLIEFAEDPGQEGPAAAERILAALADPVTIAGKQARVSASIGLAIADEWSTRSSLLRDADIAMYAAKSSGPARWTLFDAEMGRATRDRMQLAGDLESALERSEFRLVYQPVVELADGRIVGFEALLRWQHPTRGLLAPADFIELAESSGVIEPIGRWVLEEACRTVARWRRTFGADDLTVAVNVSGRQLGADDLPRHVANALELAGLEPHALILELTESVLVKDPHAAARRLNALRRLGTRVAIDDFGTGYSSLSYLHTLPIDILKIDRSFIGSMGDDDGLPAIVSAIIDLARTLQLDIVAEGIELPHQRRELEARHCAQGQGYLFARPLSAEDASDLLRAGIAGARLPGAVTDA